MNNNSTLSDSSLTNNFNNNDSEEKSLSDILNIPLPKSKFNVIFDVLNVKVDDLLEYKSDPKVNDLLKHKIAQVIVEEFNEGKNKNSNLSKNVKLECFIDFINRNFDCSENKLMDLIGTNFMEFLRSQIGKQYFNVFWSSEEKDYIVSITTAIPSNIPEKLINFSENSSINCENTEKVNSPTFGEQIKEQSFSNISHPPNYRFSKQMPMLNSGKSNMIVPIINLLNNPKPTYYMDELEPSSRIIMGKIMIYFCYYLALPRKEIVTSHFKENMTLFSGYTFNKDWYRLLFAKTTMAKMFSEIFFNEITCQSGYTGGAAVFILINEEELWSRIEENILIYNSFGVHQIDLNKLKTVKIQGSRYLLDAKNWIPVGANAITLFGFNARGYTFKCLDNCECDTDTEIIHCHNLGLEKITFPTKRLRGFIVLGLTHNNFHYLPSEEALLEKFPDLKGIDIEGNSAFDCDTLPHYKKLAIFSDCGKSTTAGNNTIDDFHIIAINAPTDDCDFECQVLRHTKSLSEYVQHLWKLILIKIEELKKSKTWKDVKNLYKALKDSIVHHLNI